MPTSNVALFALNRGILSPLALTRTGLARYALSAEIQTNWIPRALGAASLRPALEYIGGVDGDNAARMLPFVFSTGDKAVIELTENKMRIWRNDAIVSRDAVSTAITNGTFDSDLTGWTDNDDSGATSSAGSGGHAMTDEAEKPARLRRREGTNAQGT